MGKKAIERALESKMLDKSDFVLLMIEKLRVDLGEGARVNIGGIEQDYLNLDYDDAIKKINVLCDANQEKLGPDFVEAIKKKQGTLIDDPMKNQSRRFFETKYSQAVWNSQEKIEFSSLAKLNLLMKQKLTDIYGEVNISEKETESQVNAKKVLDSLPDSVVNLEDAQKVISGMRGFGEVSVEIVRVEGELRKDPSSDQKNIASLKDRGAAKPKDTKDKHGIYSANPGIIRSTSPLMPADRADAVKKNKVADSFYMNEAKPGYSASRPEVPFVNSISGTAFTLASVIKSHMDANPNDVNLEHDVNNIVKAFVGFTCKEGYHSLAEMVDALNSPSVQRLFEDRNIKMNTNFLKESDLNNVIQQSANYSKDLGLLRGVTAEVTGYKRPVPIQNQYKEAKMPMILSALDINNKDFKSSDVVVAIEKVQAAKGPEAALLALERFVQYAEKNKPDLDLSAVLTLKEKMTGSVEIENRPGNTKL